MSNRIIVRPQAQQDLLECADYIAEDSLNASDRFLEATEQSFRQLALWPGMGSLREFDNPRLAGMRMWPVPGFRHHLIFYRKIEEGIEIIRVLHGSRDIQGLLAPEDSDT